MLKILERFRRKPRPDLTTPAPVAVSRRLSRTVRHSALNIGEPRRRRAKNKVAGRSRRINRKRAQR
jgi:hypothetical protein